MKYFLNFVFYIMLASAMLSLLCILSFYRLLTSPMTRYHMNQPVSQSRFSISFNTLSLF